MFTHAVRLPRNHLLVLQSRPSEIAQDRYIQAEELFAEFTAKIYKIIGNTDSVPGCPLTTTYENKMAKCRLDDTVKNDPSKCARTGNTAAGTTSSSTSTTNTTEKAAPDKSGCLIFKAKGIMPTIDQPDTKKRICAGHARDGVFCKRVQRCPMIHNNNPTTWSPSTAKAWCKLVEDTAELEWHPTVDVEQLKARCNEA